MQTHNFLRSLPRCLLGAALVAGITTTAGVFAVDGNPPGLFELDGNTVNSLAAGDDWDSLPGGSAAFTGILADKAPLTIFTQGGSKDIRDVTEWRHTNGSVPDKDDITNAYAAGYTVQAGQATAVHKAGDLIIYFGLDRFANNGDAFAGFWFFQDNVGLGPDKKFIGKHVGRNGNQRGDLLVLVEYPQGANAQPEIKVYEWDPLDADNDNVADNLDELYSSSNAKCDGTGNKLACAITNVGNLPGEPAWSYTPKNGYAGIPFESFFEGGINVSALLGGDVPCFSSFLAETRSSRSETAQLKDFVLGDFDLCSIAVTKNCVAEVDANDGGNSILVNFSGMVTNDGGLTLNNVTVTDDMGTPGDTGDDVLVFGPATLLPGESKPYSDSYSTMAIPAEDRVTAEGHRANTTVTATADASCAPDLNPAITVDKFCTASINGSGDAIDVLFNGMVTNTGNVALENVTVVDDNGTPGNLADDVTINIGKLNAGASAPYNGSFSVSGSNTSTDHVVASGTAVLGGDAVQAKAQATCLADVLPNIAVDKFCTASINGAGTGIDVLFNGMVTNTGNVLLNNVTVVDDNGTPGNLADDVTVLGPISLAPGASAPYNGGFGVLATNSSTDVVVASGTDAITSSPVQATANATCLADVSPDLLVTKQCTDAPAFGQAILFDGSVTNNGNVALLGVIIVDDNATPGDTSDDVTFNIGDLAPGASANYNGSYTPALAGTYTNTVVASATDAVTSGPVESVPAQATCDVPPPPDFEGCTPGFWKNSPGSWPPSGYSPNQLITSVFSLPNGVINNNLGGDSLMDALNYGGGDNLLGAAQNLLRSAVASLINSAHPEVDFPRMTADVIADVNAALATKDRAIILALHSALDADNNLGCDLPNDNSF
ncbi:DUF7507 domain-containing protein [Pseudomonas zhanjiangensis]|uniref:DUF7507 domain-containing protein n=1 Tax=Pseudomonas zhanjiangensis TaxID=3239015 RepID=A0ABV3YRL9_9PSED